MYSKRKQKNNNWKSALKKENLKMTQLSILNNRLTPVVPVKKRNAGPYKMKDKLSMFEITEKEKKTFANNAAVQKTYKVKLGQQWTGRKLIDVENDLKEVIAEVLHRSRGQAKDIDLGNLYIHNEGLVDIPITLRPMSEINTDVVMEMVSRVVQSNKSVTLDFKSLWGPLKCHQEKDPLQGTNYQVLIALYASKTKHSTKYVMMIRPVCTWQWQRLGWRL